VPASKRHLDFVRPLLQGSLWAPDTQTAKYIETLTLTLRAAMRADNNLHSSLSTLRRLEVFVARLQLADSPSCGFTSQSTQNRSFRRRFPKPISWRKKLNLTQQKHTLANQNNNTIKQVMSPK